jgi:histidine phosphotransfer protein HptB
MMIDWSRLDELAAEIGPDAIDEVVAMFLDEADEVIGRLPLQSTPASREGDLHFLKGAALNLGFDRLATLCDAGERSPDTADIPAILATYAQSRAALVGGLAARRAA